MIDATDDFWGFDKDDDAPDAAAKPLPGSSPTRDPAEVVADFLIDDALLSPGLRAAVAAPGVAVVVVVPAAEWLETLCDSWRDTVRGGIEPKNSDGRQSRNPSTDWMECRRPQGGKSKPTDDAEAIASALWQGVAVTALTPDPAAYLPWEFLATADHTVTLPAVDASAIVRMLLRLTDTVATVELDAAAYAALTPTHLRLARRPDQSADDYMRRLSALVRPGLRVAPALSLDRLHGMSDAVAWGTALKIDLDAYRMGQLSWSAVDRGALLHGPTGTGKTTFARSLAATCGLPLIATSYADWQSKKDGHMGDVIRTLRQRFSEARAAAPAILFIDELDSVGSRELNGKYDEWWRAIINCLLEELDGLASRVGLVVIAATNYPGAIDPAILRAGRLDRRILIGLPDVAALAAILREHLDSDLAGVDLSCAAMAATGSTGADCERWVRGARRRARTASRAMIIADLMEEIGGEDDVRTPEIARRIAIHEAAHGVFAAVQRPGTLVSASIVGNRGSGGGVQSEGMLHGAFTPADAKIVIRMMLAGRAAEEVFLGCPSSGSGGSAASDLASATSLAVLAETSLGFGKSLVWHGAAWPRDVPGLLAQHPDLASRVAAQLARAHVDALAFVREYRGEIDAVADLLLAKTTISGREVEAAVKAASMVACRHRGAFRRWPARAIRRLRHWLVALR